MPYSNVDKFHLQSPLDYNKKSPGLQKGPWNSVIRPLESELEAPVFRNLEPLETENKAPALLNFTLQTVYNLQLGHT